MSKEYEQIILYKEEQGYVGLYFEPLLDDWVMTVKLHQWSPSEFKRYLLIWGNILNRLKEKGINGVYGLCVNADKQKFTEVFGFQPTGYVMETADGNINNVMRLEI